MAEQKPTPPEDPLAPLLPAGEPAERLPGKVRYLVPGAGGRRWRKIGVPS